MIVPASERAAWFQSQKGITLSAAHDQFLNLIQPWIEKVCWKYIGYSLEQASYTEFLPDGLFSRPPLAYGIDIGWDLVGGTAMPRSRTDLYEGSLTLTNLPVRAVASVYENLGAWTTGDLNGNWPAASLLPVQAYRLDMAVPDLCRSGRLYRVVGNWPSTPRSLKVTYTAGYTQAELDAGFGDVKMAVLEGVMWWWSKAMIASNSVKTMGLVAMQLGIRDFSVTLGNPSAMSAQPGDWVFQMLGPTSINILSNYLNMAKYVGAG